MIGVGLGKSRDVAGRVESAAHDDDLAHIGGEARVHFHGGGYVGDRANGADHHFSGMFTNASAQKFGRILGVGSAPGLRRRQRAEAFRPMNVVRRGEWRQYPGLCRALRNRHIAPDALDEMQCVACSLLDGDVAEDGGQPQKLDFRVRRRVENGQRIVNAGVCVDNQLHGGKS